MSRQRTRDRLVGNAAGRLRQRWSLTGRRLGSRDPTPPPLALLELARSGPAPLVPAERGDQLRIAAIIPPFRRGSGGHATIVRLMQELRRMGHGVSVWLERDQPLQAARGTNPAAEFAAFFGSDGIDFHADYTAWRGADVVLATGWQTVARTLLLPNAAARAYLVQDHEPDFYGASAEREWARWTYRQGLHCIAASPWLADVLRDRYGAAATSFDLGVDHSLYRPGGAVRRDDLVVFYARASTPRRAVPLGLLALAELRHRRPKVEIALYGEAQPIPAGFAHTHLGVLHGSELASLYQAATVGMALSLTNPSLVCLEMMASGLPCVELASNSMLATFGSDGPLSLAAPDPLELAMAIERLLDERDAIDEAVRSGIALMAGRTWAQAAHQVLDGLRIARERQ